jgi:peroxiredoxin Q/BCP
MNLNEGDPAPHFSGVDQNNKNFDSKEYIGKQPLVVYFYPKDFTPGCTQEACQFRDQYEEFKELGAEVIGISADSEKSHQKFSNKHNLPFRLISDANKKLQKKFGVKKSVFGLLPGRETFVIDKQGKIILKFNDLKASGHIRKAIKALKSE